MAFQDRIIAGKWKGRTLILPEDADVRPTKNRVRQAVFNMLGSRVDWEGMRVADVCCGSGAWGLEALSRGAGKVWLVDKDVATIQKNVRDIPGAEIVKGDAGTWAPPELLDVVLADPPYASPLSQKLIGRAAEIGRSGTWWAMETSVLTDLLWGAAFDNVEHRDYGGSRIWVARQI